MLCIDFETVDPYIGLGYGAGWTFALRGYNNPEFKLLGASIIDSEQPNVPVRYIDNLGELYKIISLHCGSLNDNTYIMHNAQYDIGCLLVLFYQFGDAFPLREAKFYDTMLMGKLVNQHLNSYSLENLSKRLGISPKKKDILTNYVWESGLYQAWYKEHYGRNSHKRPEERKLEECAFSHLDSLPIEIVGMYCNADVEATWALYKHYQEELDRFPQEFCWNRYSELLKICVESRQYGVRVDTDKAIETRELLLDKADGLRQEVYEAVGREFNINAPKQLIEALKDLGITGFGKTATGGESAAKDVLEGLGHPVCKTILKIKNYEKLANGFLDKIVSYQEVHRQNGSNDSRIFTNLNILGATATGRFSSSAYRKGKKSWELNIQQIPKRGEDDEASKWVRRIFLPEEKEAWISADYSNQEQRLQVHFGAKLGCEGTRSLVAKLKADVDADFHKEVADMCNIQRRDAKTINLGLSYGMGEAKLCRALGLPTEEVWSNRQEKYIEVAGPEGKDLLGKYYAFLPFMKELQEQAKTALRDFKYVKTICGRKLFIDPPMKIDDEWVTFERKGLSKLVQGSAADVTIDAMINCYRAGLRILFTVHDEICISSKDVESDSKLLTQCMNDDIVNKLHILVPMAVEITAGINWAGEKDAKSVNGNSNSSGGVSFSK